MKCKVFFFLLIAIIGNSSVYSQLSWNPKPVAEFRIDKTGIFCQNNLKFSDSSNVTNPCNMNGDSCDEIIKWTWDFSHGEKSNLRNPTHNFPLHGNFPITLKIVTKYGYNDSRKITVIFTGPQPEFNVLSDTIIEVGDTTFFKNTSLAPFDSPSWKWDFGDDGHVMSDDVTEIIWHIYSKPGKYEVVLTEYDNANGRRCPAIYPDTDLSIKKKITITVLSSSKIKNHLKPKFSVFPNPVNDQIFIKGLSKGEIVITDLTGKEVLKTAINSNQSIDISTLTKGTYFIRCSDGSESWNGRFVKVL